MLTRSCSNSLRHRCESNEVQKKKVNRYFLSSLSSSRFVFRAVAQAEKVEKICVFSKSETVYNSSFLSKPLKVGL